MVYFTVDTILPAITIDSPTNTTYAATPVDLNVSADEAIDTWMYSLGGGNNVTFTPNTTFGNWWNHAWQYRQPINIINDDTQALEAGYTVNISINTSDASKFRPDGNDVRIVFFNGSYPDGVEVDRINTSAFGSTSQNTMIWFKLQEAIPKGGHNDTAYYVYYGNPDAGGAPDDEGEVYLFYDDFEGTEIDTTKWTDITGQHSIVDGALQIKGSGGLNIISTVKTDLGEGLLETRLRTLSSAGGANQMYMYLRNDQSPKHRVVIRYDEQKWGTDSGITTTLVDVTRDTSWHVGKFRHTGGVYYSWRDGVAINTDGTYAASETPTQLGLSGYGDNTGRQFDYIMYRKYISPEPTTSLGGEEVELSDGNYNITVYATDTAGNMNSSTVNFTVDLPPQITITSPQGTVTDNTPDLNLTTNELANITYSWDTEGNISGCRNCDSYNTTYGESVPEADTSLLMHFNENTGNTTYDDSSNDNDGTLGNSSGGNQPAWTTDGKFGNALSFDGNSDFVKVLDNDTLDFSLSDSFTVEAWVKTEFSGVAQYVVGKVDTTVDNWLGYHLTVNKYGKAWFMVHDSTKPGGSWPSNIKSTKSVNDGNWHHVVAVRDAPSGVLRLYVDGMEDATPTADATSQPSTNDVPLRVGTHSGVNKQWFDGTIDEIHVIRRALSATEIEHKYNRVLPDALHSVTVYAIDNASNLNSTTEWFTVSALPNITITSPPNETITDITPDLNFTIGELANTTYSWNTEANISGCRNCDSFNTTYGESTPDADTSLLMHFNENTGNTIYDDSSNDNDGALGNSSGGNQPAWTPDGKFGNALSFDGSSDFVEVTDDDSIDFNAGTDSFTIMTWINSVGATGKAQYIVNKQKELGFSQGYHLFLKKTGELRFMIHTTDGDSDYGDIVGTTNLFGTGWRHVAAVYDASADTVGIYVDGNNDSATMQYIPTISSLNNEPLFIGAHDPVDGRYFNGSVDEVVIYNRSLTQGEIQGIYNKTLSSGQHSVTVYATDVEGNKDSATKYFTIG